MKVLVLTSTNAGGFNPTTTRINFRVGDGPAVERDYPATDQQALLEWVTELASLVEHGGDLVIVSKRNSLSEPFRNGWIDAWKKDGFRKKPAQHRKLWKTFVGCLESRQIKLSFEHPADYELSLKLSAPRQFDPPGTPSEDPWRKPETSDEMLNRALKKS